MKMISWKFILFLFLGILLFLIGVMGFLSPRFFGIFERSSSYSVNEGDLPKPQSKPLNTLTPFNPLEQSQEMIAIEDGIPNEAQVEVTPQIETLIPDNKTQEAPEIPVRIEIPSIELTAPVIKVQSYITELQGQKIRIYNIPEIFAAGWHVDSAMLGEPGNTVMNGHNNVSGEVFRDLENINIGDTIYVYSDLNKYEFVVEKRTIFADTFVGLQKRVENAKWLATSDDIRLTLVSCWPFNSYTHRIIIVAIPLSEPSPLE